METYLNLNGDECVILTNEDGTTWSGYKSAYDEMQGGTFDGDCAG
jgi:hypothetical protein